MRIFYAFLVVVTAAILWLLPLSEAIYDFRTDVKNDIFTVVTNGGETTANVTLQKPVYKNDTSTIGLLSNNSADSPAFLPSDYDVGTHSLKVIGLSPSLTRTLTVSYDVDALQGSNAIDKLVDKVPWIWLLLVIAFPIAALAAIFLNRA